MPYRFHIGTRTTSFDVLPEDLLIVEHQEGVSGGKVSAWKGGACSLQAPFNEKGRASGGFKAYRAAPGMVYEVEGVEWRPVAVKKLVRLDPEAGFVEVKEDEIAANSEPTTTLGALRGSRDQIERGSAIREAAVQIAMAVHRPDLLSGLRARTIANWYIGRQHLDAAGWLAELENLKRGLAAQSEPKKEYQQ